MSNISNFTGALVLSLPWDDAESRRRAARRVASHAISATEAAELLDVLGLTAHDGLQPPQRPLAGRDWPPPTTRGKR